jgi:hypothetical protein
MGKVIPFFRHKQTSKHYELGVDAARIAYAVSQLGEAILDTECKPKEMKILCAHAEALYYMAQMLAGMGDYLRSKNDS